ncbi:FAST kinase domain-containing protein 4 [Pyxicephalus adspersus]|uniref:FAST kinase domain-containing protein 4 n=1 Tax=Pyxicephalus adspersus TaxID=30357 RepID=A0AAV3ALL3_PYXAD|nr:TPA: hypothetical protein GDO54_012880 [Pyxicephalus adspersus]
MAARLIQRASRFLAVPISFQPLPTSVTSECMRLVQLAPSLPCQAALHTSSLCRLGDNLLQVTEDPKSDDDIEFFSMLGTISGVNELLQIASEQKISGNKGVMVIQHIARKENVTIQELMKDVRFRELLENVNNQIQFVWNSRVIHLLKCLYALGLDSKNRYIQSVEIEVRWRLRRFNIKSLAHLASFMVPLSQSRDENLLLDDLVKQAELRWTEIKDVQTLVRLITRMGFLSNSLMEKLEDKVLEFAESFTPEESRRTIATLAAQNRRSLPVLRALSFHLIQRKFELSPPVILDLAFAYAKLNFCHPQVLLKMVTDILPKLPEISPSQISMIIRSFSSLKFFNQPFCEGVAQVCLKNNDSFTIGQLCSVLFAFAHLNFQPSHNDDFFNMIHRRLNAELNTQSWQQQLYIVWSLCILNQVTTPYLQKILELPFYRQILEDDSVKSTSYCLKLLHVNTTAQMETPGYQGPLLPKDVLLSLQEKSQGRRSSNFQIGLSDVLKEIYPNPETCNINVSTIYGWHLDGEVILDSELNPFSVNDFVAPHNLQSKGTQPLPEGARRFAILSGEFSHFMFRGKEFTGRFVMNRRQLRAAGFLVVEVPYYEWQELKSDYLKKSFIKDQIKKAMAEELAR